MYDYVCGYKKLWVEDSSHSELLVELSLPLCMWLDENCIWGLKDNIRAKAYYVLPNSELYVAESFPTELTSYQKASTLAARLTN